MTASQVVIVGAGQAGADAAAGLRSRGFAGGVVLVGDEDATPYQRPPLSKGYLTGTATGQDVTLRPESYYDTHHIELMQGARAVEIDRHRKQVALASGQRLRYHRLVLALGARPRRLLVPGAELAGVLYLRSLADADALRQRLSRASHLVVIGGGFIGLELAATAREAGIGVTVVEAAPRVMGRAVSVPASRFLTGVHRRRGVRILLGREVRALHGDHAGQVLCAELDGGERVPADVVVVGIGVVPNIQLAVAAGLAVGDGILVDGQLCTRDPAIRAIGDCARFPSRQAASRLRLESVQNASDQARYVAAGLTGRTEPFQAVPSFWTQQYDVRLQIAGATGRHDRTVVTGDPTGGRFSVFCFRDERLLGVESVNRPADYAIARRLLAAGIELPPSLVARPGFDLKVDLQGSH